MREIKKPDFMLEALRGRRGFIMILELLIFIAVFFVSSLAMGIGILPVMVGYLFSDSRFMDMVSAYSSGNLSMEEYMQNIQRLALDLPEWIMIVTLLLEILMIVVVIIYCRFLEKRKVRTMGFRREGTVSQYLLGAVAGILFFTVAYLFCVVTGSVHMEGLAGNIAPLYIIGYLAGYMVQGMAEEVLCRGYLFVSLSRRHSVVFSAIVSALCFMLLHGSNSGVTGLAFINLFLFGVFAALMLVRFENIWIVGAFHSLWNFAQGNLYGIQVSGNSLQPSVIASSNRPNMDIINGGKFGLEGGLGVTIVFVLGIIWLLMSLNKQGKLIEWKGLRPTDSEYNNGNPQVVYQPNGYAQNMRQPNGYGNGAPQQMNRPMNGMPMQAPPPTMPAQPAGQPVKRENMGTEPGETPWRPEQEKQEQKQVFGADYFKD